MKYCHIEKVETMAKTFYIIADDCGAMITEPSKFLKCKTLEHCSPNTVRNAANALHYYLDYLHAIRTDEEGVLSLDYLPQYEHFTAFLTWLKAGEHTDGNKPPENSTCNSYLHTVFGYYRFLNAIYGAKGELKVLEDRTMTFTGAAGVRYTRETGTFKGYLPQARGKGRTIDGGSIEKLVEAATTLRDKLLLLLLAETGFRIGEVLGIRYGTDIDFERRAIHVTPREDNENNARAKYNEERRAVVGKATFDVLSLYITENRELLLESDYLFVTLVGKTRGRPMTFDAVYSMLRTLEKRTGIKATPHMLRHYFANERRKEGWDIMQIGTALGHKHEATTEIYLDVEQEELADVMEQYYGEHAGLYEDISKLL